MTDNNGGKGLKLIYALLLAALFWLLNALSNTYTSNIEISANYTTPSKGFSTIGNLPKTIKVTYQDMGRVILWNNIVRSLKSLEIDLIEDVELNENQEDGLVTKDLLLRKATQELSQSSRIISMEPSSIYVTFEEVINKKVPIVIDVDWAKHLNPINYPVVPEFDSVTITGPKSILENIPYWKTEIVSVKESISNQTRIVNLLKPDDNKLSINPSEVELNIYLDEYTSTSYSVELKKINIPSDIEIHTNTVEAIISFSVPLSKLKFITDESIALELDFEEVNLYEDTAVAISINKFPSMMKNVSIEPDSVKFYIVE